LAIRHVFCDLAFFSTLLLWDLFFRNFTGSHFESEVWGEICYPDVKAWFPYDRYDGYQKVERVLRP